MVRKQTIIEIDIQLLNYFKIHGRLSPRDLSRELNLPYIKSWRHIRKLEKYGKIQRRGNNYELTEVSTLVDEKNQGQSHDR